LPGRDRPALRVRLAHRRAAALTTGALAGPAAGCEQIGAAASVRLAGAAAVAA
jgi:hypothetical protein